MTATLILHDGHETTYELAIKELTIDNELIEIHIRTDGKGRPLSASEFTTYKTVVDLRGFVTKKVR